MITLFTGVPGASKSLNCIKYVNEQKQFEKITFENEEGVQETVNRQIYYYNIAGFKYTNLKGKEVIRTEWKELTKEQLLTWWELPSGAVIVIDEVQDIFPMVTKRSGEPPEYIARMAKHRHKGIDFVLMTQHPMKMDILVRRDVQLHRHYERIKGMEAANYKEWENKCVENPEKDFHARQEAGPAKLAKFDKKYYGVYKSADFHTQKSRIPWFRLSMFGLGLLLLPALLWWFIDDKFIDDDIQPPASEERLPATGSGSGVQLASSASLDGETLTKEQWLTLYTPRIEGLSHTAPIYDELTKPRSFPRIAACIYSHTDDQCKCYTQQATPLSVPRDMCMDIVKNRYFDDTLIDPARTKSRNVREKSPSKPEPERLAVNPSLGRFRYYDGSEAP